jgi:hypothetical protein
VDDPELVVAVMVDEPRPYYGGIVAAPVFSEVMDAALTRRRVPPDLAGRTLSQALEDARQAAENAAQEGPATGPDAPGSPPVGSPAGGGRPPPPPHGWTIMLDPEHNEFCVADPR